QLGTAHRLRDEIVDTGVQHAGRGQRVGAAEGDQSHFGIQPVAAPVDERAAIGGRVVDVDDDQSMVVALDAAQERTGGRVDLALETGALQCGPHDQLRVFVFDQQGCFVHETPLCV